MRRVLVTSIAAFALVAAHACGGTAPATEVSGRDSPASDPPPSEAPPGPGSADGPDDGADGRVTEAVSSGSPMPVAGSTVRSEETVVVPLFGIAGCPAPPPTDEPPRVRVAPPDPRHLPLPPPVVARVIRQARDAFAQCYTNTDAHRACRNADVEVDLFVDAAGLPRQAEVTAEDPGLGECTSGALRALRFPEPDGGGTVRVLFDLEYRVVAP